MSNYPYYGAQSPPQPTMSVPNIHIQQPPATRQRYAGQQEGREGSFEFEFQPDAQLHAAGLQGPMQQTGPQQTVPVQHSGPQQTVLVQPSGPMHAGFQPGGPMHPAGLQLGPMPGQMQQADATQLPTYIQPLPPALPPYGRQPSSTPPSPRVTPGRPSLQMSSAPQSPERSSMRSANQGYDPRLHQGYDPNVRGMNSGYNPAYAGMNSGSDAHLRTMNRGFDSRTNSELYSESIASTGPLNHDSRYGSEANLLASRYGAPPSGQQTPQWSDSTLASDVNLLKYGARSPSPGPKSQVYRQMYQEKTTATIFARDWKRDGSIIKEAERDDVGHLPNWKRHLFRTTPIFVVLSFVVYWVYFVYRIHCLLDAQHLAGQPYPLAWIFIAVELSVVLPTLLHSFMIIFIMNPRKRPKLRLCGDDVPDVDIFITCCREETDLVMDTTRAACDIDYPMNRFRVIVLDDGRDQDLQDAVEELQHTKYPNLNYRAREKIPGKPHHFKAGNLNYGFEEAAKMPGGAAQFAAALDADMIPERHWIRSLMPHMLVDERMALACPPQLFYNVPKEDPLAQSLDFFVHVLEGIKDSLGVAWCTGSGYLLRREALEEIGWFPLGSLAEDVATSTLMLGKGWKTAFIHEPLQFGTVPDSFGSHLKQRTRWAIGTVDTAFKLKFCLYGDAIRQMTFFQRLSGFIYAVLSLFTIFMSISLFAFPIVLITGKSLVAYANEAQLRWLIRLAFAALTVARLTQFVMYLPSGYSIGQNESRSHFWMSPYIALTLVRTFVLPTWLGGEKQAFKPSGSLSSELNERDGILRAGLFTRLRVIVFSYMAWYHVLFVYFILTAATLSTVRCVFDQYSLRGRSVCLLTHAFWPPVSWVLVVGAFWVPLTYAIDPPTVPPRDELLVRDPKTLVAHPKDSSKKIVWGRRRNWFEMEYSLTTVITIFIFAAAFIWL